MSIKITDNTEKVKSDIERMLSYAIAEIAGRAESYAKANCPVDTGRLRNSIRHELKGTEASIGSEVDYSKWVEHGARGRTGVHFLKDSIDNHSEEYKAVIENWLKNV